MTPKTILIVDDEQSYVEALADALLHGGYRVLKARSVEDAIKALETNEVDVATIDVMMPPGRKFEDRVESHQAGVFLCREIRNHFRKVEVLCISVISDKQTIAVVKSLGIRFFKKGEVPLETVLDEIRRLTSGIVYMA